MFAAALEYVGQVVLGFGLDIGVLDRRVLVGQQPLGGREHGVGPAPERADLAGGQAELLADHDAGQRERELLDELAAAAAGEGVDELVADALHVGDHLADPAGREDLVQQAAVAGVFGRVGLVQGRHVRPALFGEALVEQGAEGSGLFAGELLQVEGVGEGLGVAQDGAQVFVAGQDVEAGAGHAEHGLLFAQLVVVGERIGLDGWIQEEFGVGFGHVGSLGWSWRRITGPARWAGRRAWRP
jgi:hypothetical protein